MSKNPYPYQRKGIDEILDKFKEKDRVIYQLSTGGGKTVIFSHLAKEFIESYGGKVLILCHRKELIQQASIEMAGTGLSYQTITPETKKIDPNTEVYIGMIETVNNRLKKNPDAIKGVSLLINDEAHILIFNKVFKYFPAAKILGCTATPCLLKRVTFYKCKHCKENYQTPTLCHGEVSDEWSKPYTLSEIYQDIVVGPEIDYLIEFGQLVKEISIAKVYTDNSVLKVDSDGEFTTESTDAAYNSEEAVFNVLKNYKQHCEGKKTIIFNSSAKNNRLVYERFVNEGYNIRMFDSVNSDLSGKREELVKWFEDTDDAILCNVNVFTTGFDSKEVQAIILNRPTLSLALFLQMVGRGGRASQKIYKDSFIVVDGGANIDRHQEWSDPTRDWRRIFFEGVGKEKAKKQDAFDVQTCPNDECGAIYAKTEPECPECGFIILPSKKLPKISKESESLLLPIREIPPPNGEKIYQYTLKKGENINFAFKILISQVVDMFRYYLVTKEKYLSSQSLKRKGQRKSEYEEKLMKLIHKPFFVLISKPDIQAQNNRTIKYLKDKITAKLNEYYGV